MFQGKQTNYKINRIHKRATRIVCNNYVSSFQDLLNKDNSFTIHHQNIQSLATKIYKTLLVTLRTDSCSLRLKQEFIMPKVSTALKGKNSLRYFGAFV